MLACTFIGNKMIWLINENKQKISENISKNKNVKKVSIPIK